MENDFFKGFGQKWKVRNGAVVVVFSKDFCQVMALLLDSGWMTAGSTRRV